MAFPDQVKIHADPWFNPRPIEPRPQPSQPKVNPLARPVTVKGKEIEIKLIPGTEKK